MDKLLYSNAALMHMHYQVLLNYLGSEDVLWMSKDLKGKNNQLNYITIAPITF